MKTRNVDTMTERGHPLARWGRFCLAALCAWQLTVVAEEPPVSAETPDSTAAPIESMPIQKPTLSPGVDKIVTLAQAGVTDAVLLDYVKKANMPFDLSAEEIVYLKDIGVSDAVLSTMLRSETAGNSVTTAVETVAPPIPEPSPAPIQVEAPQTPPPAPEPVTTAAPAPVTSNYFYDSLSPYGNWVLMPVYGWCWQPSCARLEVGWMPYGHRGHWVYTDSGWYWASDYSWGWAPFHYGRWHHASCGWVWLPGYEWGPAWVAWRSNGGYCGWAPLPPAARWHATLGLTYNGVVAGVSCSFGLGFSSWCFVSTSRFCEREVYRHAVPHHNVVNIYNHTTIINHYGVGKDHGFVNHGISPSHITAVTHQAVPQVRIHSMSAAQAAVTRPDRMDRSRSELAVYRPSVPPTLRATPNRTTSAPVAGAVRPQQQLRRDVTSAPTRAGNASPTRSQGQMSRAETRTGITPLPRSVAENSRGQSPSLRNQAPSRAATPAPTQAGTRSTISSPQPRSTTQPAQVTRPTGPSGATAPTRSPAAPSQAQAAPRSQAAPYRVNPTPAAATPRGETQRPATTQTYSAPQRSAASPAPPSYAPAQRSYTSPASAHTPSSPTRQPSGGAAISRNDRQPR